MLTATSTTPPVQTPRKPCRSRPHGWPNRRFVNQPTYLFSLESAAQPFGKHRNNVAPPEWTCIFRLVREIYSRLKWQYLGKRELFDGERQYNSQKHEYCFTVRTEIYIDILASHYGNSKMKVVFIFLQAYYINPYILYLLCHFKALTDLLRR